MPDITLGRPVACLQVSELVELIRKIIREEFADLFAAVPENDLTPTSPPIRDIDTIIARMQATGKYNKKFLASLRKGMQRAQTFGAKPQAKI
jgi:hypothetical protein